ncbi:glycosyl hydrolase family 8 [Quadrisphaera sp. KR29]|uniref:glycosyl hydrolase family 8 n=1 Tax=Quadrisphaera sp. KR29 TaxID=3461391 RepID=UPI00404459A2
MSLDQVEGAGPAPSQDAPRGPEHAPRRSRTRGWLTGGAVAAALVLVLAVALQLTGGARQAGERIVADTPMVPSEGTALGDMWASYKADFLEGGSGRTLDPSQGGITTSEGQSYTMMRAVWSDDRATFDSSWQWTKDNLQRPDRLLSWRFGPRADGTYGIQTDSGGQNAASDADVDVAFSLLMAYSRWQDDDYLYDALPLIDAVWQYEVVDVAGRPVLTANDLERDDTASVLVNPSYFAPYAYRAFSRVDPGHDWNGLVDSSYDVLQQVSADPLGGQAQGTLAPDWVRLDRTTGEASVATGITTTTGSTTDFGFEALRLPWRLALDARWNDEPRARALLEQQASVLGAAWETEGRWAAVYTHAGQPAVDYASTAMHGGALGALELARPVLAREVYRTELLSLYDPDTRAAKPGLGYYDANWAWFGMALHLDQLPDLNDPRGRDLP